MLYDLQTTAKKLGINRKTLSQYVDIGLIGYKKGRGRKRWFTDTFINNLLNTGERSKASKYFDNNILMDIIEEIRHIVEKHRF